MDIDVLVVWYCRGCKRNVEQAVPVDAERVVCPLCKAEKSRFDEDKK